MVVVPWLPVVVVATVVVVSFGAVVVSLVVVACSVVVVSPATVVVVSVVVVTAAVVVVSVVPLFGRYAPTSVTLEVAVSLPPASFAHQICTSAVFCAFAASAIFASRSGSVTLSLPLLVEASVGVFRSTATSWPLPDAISHF